jgi:hypothetical protein
MDSTGSIVKSAANLSNDSGASDEVYRADAIQIGTGNSIVAWNTRTDMRFALLDTGYNRIAGPTLISHPAMRWERGSYYSSTNFSLAADPTGHAVLTWMDPDYNNSQRLYYALIKSDGTLQTPPMIFLYDEYQIVSGLLGYSNTSYTINSTTSDVDAFILGPEDNLISSSGSIDIPVQFGNLGLTSATSIVVTATLANGLSYISDTSGVIPTTETSTTGFADAPLVTKLTWNLSSSMNFLGAGRFELLLGVGLAQLGTTYPVSLNIQTSGSDGNAANNTYDLNVTVAAFNYLPSIKR